MYLPCRPHCLLMYLPCRPHCLLMYLPCRLNGNYVSLPQWFEDVHDLLQGHVPTICGGCLCFALQNQTWTQTSSLNNCRYYASSLTMAANRPSSSREEFIIGGGFFEDVRAGCWLRLFLYLDQYSNWRRYDYERLLWRNCRRLQLVWMSLYWS